VKALVVNGSASLASILSVSPQQQQKNRQTRRKLFLAFVL